MQEYLDAGVVGFGIGSNIVDKKLVGEGRFAEVSALAKTYTKAIG